MLNKKAISPVVAIALLLVVSVVAVVGFQNWYQSYSSEMFSDLETESNSNEKLDIQTVIGNTLYVVSGSSSNVTLNKLQIGGIDCTIDKNLSNGMNEINVSSCLGNVSDSTPEIMIMTEDRIVKESVYLEDIVLNSNSIDFSNAFISVWNTSKAGSAVNTIVLPLYNFGNAEYNFTVYWGDGSNENVIGTGSLPISHA
ncbi:MAG: hypothetical protein PF569_01180 [Candidatus Woesearchaeota archaeon]|jgi:hypothetical protein|nr:hypothetical protein [Candidatus Woesearchaeota archaeon]